MLHCVLGRAGSGKTTCLMEQAKRLLQEECKELVLLVPEQFTFETEKKYYRALGAKAMERIKVLSFTRLARQIFLQCGGGGGVYADEPRKLLLMHMAVSQLKDQLSYYQKSGNSVSFLTAALEMVSDCRAAAVSVTDWEDKVSTLPEGMLKQKATELSLLYSTYTALLQERYQDAPDDLTLAAATADKAHFFAGKSVLLDEFSGFTEAEYEMIKVMLRDGVEVYVSLCMPWRQEDAEDFFTMIRQTHQKLVQLARTQSVSVATPITLEESVRYASPALGRLEQYLYANQLPPDPSEPTEAVQMVLASDIHEEVTYTAAAIRKLVQEKQYRYRDIVVVSRNPETYVDVLQNVFTEYEIPVYLDQRKGIRHHGLVRLIEKGLGCILEHGSADALLAFLKCDLNGYSTQTVAMLENYVYLWSVKGENWTTPFTQSIFGSRPPMGEAEQKQQTQTLQEINRVREHLMQAMELFAGDLAGATGFRISLAVRDFLEMFQVQQQLQLRRTLLLQDESDPGRSQELAKEYGRVWEQVTVLLQVLAEVLGDTPIDLKRYFDLFVLLASHADLGTVPQTLDSVLVGDAKRLRVETPRAVFVLGVNEGVFPLPLGMSPLFTAKEEEQLASHGLRLHPSHTQFVFEEQFVVYKTLTLPAEHLCLTARCYDTKGNGMLPSGVWDKVHRILNITPVQAWEIDPMFYCCSEASAFRVLAKHFREDNPLTASLRRYFTEHPLYGKRMARMGRSAVQAHRLQDTAQLKQFLGDKTLLSPSRVERYYQCPFSYFCEYGLQLKPRERVQLNAVNRGVIIHHVLHRVCQRMIDTANWDNAPLRQWIREALNEYLEEFLGGIPQKTKRFLYLYRRLTSILQDILEAMVEELSQSAFRPALLECDVSPEGEVAPFRLTTESGIQIGIIGKIDRVDVYRTATGREYVRVIDYKSGTKKFRLSDVVNGLNLQMFLYLMCLQNSHRPFAEPRGAGVLYMPAKEATPSLGANVNEEDTQKEKRKQYCMHGVVLDEEDVLFAMERKLEGVYTPVSVTAKAKKKDETFRDDLFCDRHANERYFSAQSMESMLTAEQMGRLFGSLQRTVSNMVEALYQGEIPANPMVKTDRTKPCDYCAYRALCGWEDGHPQRDYQSMNKKQVMQYLEEEEESHG